MKKNRIPFLAAVAIALALSGLGPWAAGAPAQTNSVLAPPRTESQYRPLEWSYFGTGGGSCVQEVAAAPSRPDRMYASIDVGGTYVSDDGGLHWRTIYAPLSRFNNWATRPYCIAVSYQDPDVFYFVGEMGPFTSRDGGRTWLPTLLSFSGNLRGYNRVSPYRVDLGYPSSTLSQGRGITMYYYHPIIPATSDIRRTGNTAYDQDNYLAVAVVWDPAELAAAVAA